MMPLLLASTSPRRRELLARAGLSFECMAPMVEEIDPCGMGPSELVLHHAEGKARAVAGRHPSHLVLGADTLVALDGTVYSKPVDLEDARRMLRALSGRRHSVFTGVCLIGLDRGIEERFVEESRVTFHPLSESRIDAYLAKVDPLDKAGAYAAQEHRAEIIAEIEGLESNVIGLPVEVLLRRLRQSAGIQ